MTNTLLCRQVPTPPRLIIPYRIAQQLYMYVDAIEGEISGLGTVVTQGTDLVVEELFLLDQECTTASTYLYPDAVATLLNDFVSTGRNPATLRLWWHSHYTMSCGWSGTDNDTINQFSADWMISLVCNRQRERLARLDLTKPFRLSLDISSIIPVNEDAALRTRVSNEVKQKVTLKQPVHTWKRWQDTDYQADEYWPANNWKWGK